jgi:hypothetical protein
MITRHWSSMALRWCVVAMLACLSHTALAQYDEPREFTPLETRFIALGVLDRDFQPRDSNTMPDSAAIRYRNYMPVISFHQGPFSIAFGYTRYIRDGVSREAVHFGSIFTQDLPLSAGRTHTFSIPICLAADFTKAQAGGLKRDDFNIASLGIGVGLRYQYRSPALDASVHALGIVHYSFEGLSTGSGSSTALDCDAHLMIKTIHIGEGIALGYRLRVQQWSLSDARFDHHAIHHGPYIGIML